MAHKLEADILNRINLPQIPGFVDAFTFNGVHYIAQEFIEGFPLSYYVCNGYRFNEDEVKQILYQLLSILGYLHCPPQKENAIVHRDIRLSNILLHNGRIFLIDFGFARYLDPAQFPFVPDPVSTRYNVGNNAPGKLVSTKIPGAVTYRILRREISVRSDLFGAGVVGVDLFTNMVEEPALFKKPWQSVLPLSEPFTYFLEQLLKRSAGFKSAGDALRYMDEQLLS